jgi:hypothetical protein
MTTKFSKTETLRRLDAGAKLAKQACDLPTGAMVEVGLRCLPQHAETAEEALDRRYPEGDDLADFNTREQAAKGESLQTYGAVVHLYFYTRSGFDSDWELEDVCCVWLGTPGQEPVLLDTDGRPAFTVVQEEDLDYDGQWYGLGDDDPARCPACGEPIDYCQGHGESGDHWGAATLAAHDAGNHGTCDPRGCEQPRGPKRGQG